MNAFVEIANALNRFEGAIARRIGPFGAGLSQWLLFVLFPLVLVVLPGSGFAVAASVAGAASLVGVIANVIVGIAGSSEIEYETGLRGVVRKEGFSSTLGMVLSWLAAIVADYAAIYTAIERLAPGRHFTVVNPTIPLVDFGYFSMVTITTVGYGDVVPKSCLAKMLCMSEMAGGAVAVLVALALVVSAGISDSGNEG
jgi:voltage-gated potassium channel Kch